MVLAKALDDICPTFQGEAEEEKKLKIADRISSFARSEVELDKEWEELEKEAVTELDNFIKERDTIFAKIAKTNNSDRVRAKITDFESKKKARVDYLARKMDRDVESLKEKLSGLKKGTKKYAQISGKITQLEKTTAAKIKKTELRYNTIIKNTMNSDNAERVLQRIEQSRAVWDRKYKELKERHLVKETIHNSRRMENDQIRIAINSFSNEVEYIKHWCTLSDVTLKECYTEAVRRAKMVKRNYSGIEKVLEQISAGDI
jgi:DNA repair exonuclease SbcCD ATPase subunit